MKVSTKKKSSEMVNENLIRLGQICYMKPSDVSREEFDKLVHSYMDFQGHILFPLGEYAAYVYDFNSDSIIRIGDNIEHILGISAREVMATYNRQFFAEFLAVEHAQSLVKFSTIFYNFICERKDQNLMVMLEINMETRSKEKKRILIQFKPALYDTEGKPAATWGLFTDITHIKKEGLPTLICIENGKVVSTHSGEIAEILNPDRLPLNAREIELLSLRSKGLHIKEIAEKMKLQKSTIFSYLRNIKRKTNMDILPLIRLLTEMGVIS